MKTKIIVPATWKGGTGKTTVTAATMKNLANRGKKVLGIDFDDNLTMSKMFKLHSFPHTSLDFIYDGRFEPVEVLDNFFFIPSSKRNQTLSNVPERKIGSLLKKVDTLMFDYIFLDTPGEINALTRSAVSVADLILIPTMPSSLDEGTIEETMAELEAMNVEADIQIILNGFDTKRNMKGIVELLKNNHGDFFHETPIPAMLSMKNLMADFYNYNLSGRAKEIIDMFVQEVIL